MTSVDELLGALPIRDIETRCGTYGNCGGVAYTLVDLEPGTAAGVEVVGAVPELDGWDDYYRELVEERVEHVGAGVRTRLRELFGVEPAVRVVVRRVNPEPTQTTAALNRRAGRLAVDAAVRMAGVDLDMPDSAPSEIDAEL